MGKRSNGEGTIFKRKDGRWCAQIVAREGGKEKRKTVYGKTQREVKEKMKMLKDTQEIVQASQDTIKLGEWVKQWLEEYKKPKVKITTYQGYWMMFRSYIEKSVVSSTELPELTTSQLQRYYNGLWEKGRCDGTGGLSPRMVRYVYILINGALEQAVRNEIILKNVNKYVTLPAKQKAEISPLTCDELERFLRYCREERLYALYVLEINTGMRKGELLGLKWSDVNFDKRLLSVTHNLALVAANDVESDQPRKSELILTTPKSDKSRRTIPMNDFVIHQLREHKQQQEEEKRRYADIYMDRDLVFCREDGSFINPRFLLQNFQDILKRAGIRKYRFHDLRHTVASLLIEHNESPKAIQELLGHSSITVTMDIYGHISEDSKRGTINRLGDILCSEIQNE
ncbi:tyrosine-type recombinase/integrase [Enterocloster lavalensis]|uniref:tyrosine-type recombinase/integrase n=1 Tax=Enterocloster lavalensis TaxID=460384 RepID=UPI00266539FC|nr:tyrosine-type recombinase/integrase [Enterocloster lavalensis]